MVERERSVVAISRFVRCPCSLWWSHLLSFLYLLKTIISHIFIFIFGHRRGNWGTISFPRLFIWERMFQLNFVFNRFCFFIYNCGKKIFRPGFLREKKVNEFPQWFERYFYSIYVTISRTVWRCCALKVKKNGWGIKEKEVVLVSFGHLVFSRNYLCTNFTSSVYIVTGSSDDTITG